MPASDKTQVNQAIDSRLADAEAIRTTKMKNRFHYMIMCRCDKRIQEDREIVTGDCYKFAHLHGMFSYA